MAEAEKDWADKKARALCPIQAYKVAQAAGGFVRLLRRHRGCAALREAP